MRSSAILVKPRRLSLPFFLQTVSVMRSSAILVKLHFILFEDGMLFSFQL